MTYYFNSKLNQIVWNNGDGVTISSKGNPLINIEYNTHNGQANMYVCREEDFVLLTKENYA